MSEGRRSKSSSTSVLHQSLSTKKRICDDTDDEDDRRASPKKFRSDAVGYLGRVGHSVTRRVADVHERRGSSARKRISDDEADDEEERRSSSKKYRSDAVGYPGRVGHSEMSPVTDVHERKVPPGKRGRKKKERTPDWLPSETARGTESHGSDANPWPSDELVSQPSSSGTSLYQVPIKTPERRVHFDAESLAADDDRDVVEAPPGRAARGLFDAGGCANKDQGVQVKLGDHACHGVGTLVTNRGVQTVESSWNVLGLVTGHFAAPCDSQAERKPVDLVPEARSNKSSVVQGCSNPPARKEPEAGGSRASGGPQSARQQVVDAGGIEMAEAGSSIDRPQGYEARRGGSSSSSSSSRVPKGQSTCTTIFADHSHVHLELVIEFLFLCLIMWFFRYR